MVAGLVPVIAATTQWLVRAFPGTGGVFQEALVHAQARQAVTVAAWLRYPSALDVELLALTGPGGSARLDRLAGAEAVPRDDPEERAWRTWVDEVVASWAATLLTVPALVEDAVEALAQGEHTAGLPVEFRRLARPDERDRRAAALLRHPDLLAPVTALHRAELIACLAAVRSGAP